MPQQQVEESKSRSQQAGKANNVEHTNAAEVLERSRKLHQEVIRFITEPPNCRWAKAGRDRPFDYTMSSSSEQNRKGFEAVKKLLKIDTYKPVPESPLEIEVTIDKKYFIGRDVTTGKLQYAKSYYCLVRDKNNESLGTLRIVASPALGVRIQEFANWNKHTDLQK